MFGGQGDNGARRAVKMTCRRRPLYQFSCDEVSKKEDKLIYLCQILFPFCKSVTRSSSHICYLRIQISAYKNQYYACTYNPRREEKPTLDVDKPIVYGPADRGAKLGGWGSLPI